MTTIIYTKEMVAMRIGEQLNKDYASDDSRPALNNKCRATVAYEIKNWCPHYLIQIVEVMLSTLANQQP